MLDLAPQSRGRLPLYFVFAGGCVLRAAVTGQIEATQDSTAFPDEAMAFMLMLLAAGMFMAAQRPWATRKGRGLEVPQLTKVAINGAAMACGLLVWLAGLERSGVLSALLFEHIDICLFALSSAVIQHGGSSRGAKLQGGLIMCFGLTILIWGRNAKTMVVGHEDHHGAEALDLTAGLADGEAAAAAGGRVLLHAGGGEGALPPKLAGLLYFTLHALISSWRARFARGIAGEVGGAKRLQALSSAAAAAFLAPIMLYRYAGDEAWRNSEASIFSISSLLAFLVMSFGFIVAKFYLDSVAQTKFDKSIVPKLALVSTFLGGVLLDLVSEEPVLTAAEVMGFIPLAIGTHIATQALKADSSTSMSHASQGSIAMQARKMMKHVMAQDDTRMIFYFLSLNLFFMVVELVVGFLTNSLGLISDAGHMFFDNSALIIGLAASYIAKWNADGEFTYGYHRVEVLSGFVNAVLLVFIAGSVLMEALQRFYNPVEVHTDNLIATSVAGLLVNLVGMFAFGEHGHSHGPGGGHGHSHGPPKKAHDHGHGHGHDHGDHGHGHGDHGHGHGGDDHGHGHGGGGCPSESEGNSVSENLNLHAMWIHVLADTLGSVGVIISSLLIHYWGWHASDPVCSVVMSVLIFLSAVPLTQQCAAVLLQQTPNSHAGVLHECLRSIARLEGVTGVRSCHLWENAPNNNVGTLHVQVEDACDEQRILTRISGILSESLSGTQLTVQIEKGTFVAEASGRRFVDGSLGSAAVIESA